MASWISAVCRTTGIDIHYLRTGGAKPSVVLLHGLAGSGATWTPVARTLARHFDVVMPDARGHGDSSAPPGGYHYDDLARDVAGLIRSLDLARPVLVGHSMGGMTAALVASREPALLRALVLVDPTFLSAERQREVYASDVAELHRQALSRPMGELVADIRARHPHRSREVAELQAAARLTTRVEAFEILTPPNPDYRESMRALVVPTLLVVGDTSPVVTREMAAELFDLNSRVEVVEVAGAGHGVPFDKPERLGEVIASYVGELV